MPLPDDVTLSRMLEEGRDTWIAMVAGESQEMISEHRRRLSVQQSLTSQRQGGKRFLETWGPRMQAAGVLTADEAKAVLTDAGILKALIVTDPPGHITVGEVLVTIRRWCKEHGGYPLRADLCMELAPKARDWMVYDRIRTLLRLREVDETADARLRPVAGDTKGSQVVTYYMDLEEIARRYGPPGSTRPRQRTAYQSPTRRSS